MTAFDPTSDLSEDLAFQMLSFSPVTLFFRAQTLTETTTWLTAGGYQVVEFDASDWDSHTMHEDLARALSFPPYFGHNLDAVNDCMRDVVNQDYGWRREATGLVLAFSGYDEFVRSDRRTAQILLDIIANHSRAAALIGRRLLCLVQTDDPDLELDPVGASPAWWNWAEWLRSNRD